MDQAQSREMIVALAKTLGINVDQTVIAEVVRLGDKLILPEGASIPEVIEVLKLEHAKESQTIKVNTTVDCAPWDGAFALAKAIEQELGFVLQKEQWDGAEQMEIEVEYGKTATVQWGKFRLPGMENAVARTAVKYDPTDGVFNFFCEITCLRKFEKRARKLLDTMRHLATTHSLHRGKAFSIRFRDDDGDLLPMPTPKFFPMSDEVPIFRADLESSIERNIYTPLRMRDQLRRMGESLKRGVLFVGKYGTGKTLLASAISRVAVECGWTFIYVKESSELPQALKMAQRYQPAVVFAEDVDRVAGDERTDDVNDLLNQLDGIDSKRAELMTILTSNHVEDINAAMRRPGRIDIVLQVLPPDPDTVQRMVHQFSRGRLAADADLSGIGSVLAGFSASHIREAVSRARLEALRRTKEEDATINGNDLEVCAREVRDEDSISKPGVADGNESARAVAADFLDGAAKALRVPIKTNGAAMSVHAN